MGLQRRRRRDPLRVQRIKNARAGAMTLLRDRGRRQRGRTTQMYDIDRHLPGHPALGSTKLEIAPGQRATPGAAVGVWFIPVANLVLGYRTVRHLWRESQPAPTLVPDGVILPSSTPLLSWWWGLFVARNVGSRLFAVGAPNANTLA